MAAKFLSVDKEARFPNLDRSDYQVTSDETADYNCIAHAAGKDDNWWWPDDPPAYWPDGHDRTDTIEAFVKAYATVGFSLIEDDNYELEVGIEKIAIYVDGDGIPTHAARQLEDGSWTSKLGEWEDIQHKTLNAVEDKGDLGLGYGKVAVILRKQRTP
ncbi:MAG: DUF7689 domain-containing protein [Acidobacteriota bacterium]|uniref:DUF7689 domain-containing protein n=1 Tax=Methyloceanibacter sp. TaxID=1965321 RepID=UPI003D6C8536